MRHRGRHPRGPFRRQARQHAERRCDQFVKGEHRRSVESPAEPQTGLPSQTARQSGFPGFSATPCATIPGAPSSAISVCRQDRPPLSTCHPDRITASWALCAARIAQRSASASSAIAPAAALRSPLPRRRRQSPARSNRKCPQVARVGPAAPNSSPVDRTATRGFRQTGARSSPTAASIAISRAEMDHALAQKRSARRRYRTRQSRYARRVRPRGRRQCRYLPDQYARSSPQHRHRAGWDRQSRWLWPCRGPLAAKEHCRRQ